MGALREASTGQRLDDRVDPEINHKKTHSWYKLYGACVFLYLISQWRGVPCEKEEEQVHDVEDDDLVAAYPFSVLVNA
eukprot:938479-Rhodomonas_salina.3